jgi:hypothetical protein
MTPPPSLAAFLAAQVPVGVNLDYEHGFGRKAELRAELVAEQFGLCGYTGAPVDERLAELNPPAPPGASLPYRVHIEHLKPQSVCRQELRDRGLEPGRDLGEDVDHHNLIAALLVVGAEVELFGAAARSNRPVPVWPTHSGCETRFQFDRNGRVRGLDPDAVATVEVLRLDHDTLCGWRRAALDVFLDPTVIRSRDDLEELISRLDHPAAGRLVEYSFAIKSVAIHLLDSASHA